MGDVTWIRRVQSVRVKSREAYTRDLMSQCFKFTQPYLLAKICHRAQNFPTTQDCVRRLMSAIVWFVWLGAVFSVLVSTLQRKKEGVVFAGRCSKISNYTVHSAVAAVAAGGLGGESV
jgi:hypothetical protein